MDSVLPTGEFGHPRPGLLCLRTIVSVFCGVLVVAVCALWVQSYWRCHRIVWTGDAGTFSLFTEQANLNLQILNDRALLPEGWSGESFPIDDRDDNSLSEGERKRLLGFGWESDKGALSVDVPFWFLALACAVPPWIRWRFSLRTLLVATTMVAVVLGLAAWAGQR